MYSQSSETNRPSELSKTPTGIIGFDEVTGGGLPVGRPTLISGSAGCGKTLFAMEFLVRGATQYGEPGVFMSFEESAEELTANVRSMGFDLTDLSARKKILMDHVHIERSEIEETGEYDLEGLFIRLGHAIATIGAKRVVLDTIEALFAGLPNHAILRAELRRLFRWLKERGMTAVITGEKVDTAMTRYGLEEYVADCVITLDHRVNDQISTRRLRVMKYRGTSHGTNEYPFIIGQNGISVLPITSLQLNHQASEERISTGIAKLDDMLGGQGAFRGSSILITGTPGSGKSSFVARFAEAACTRGERTLLFAYEESPAQLLRNMRSIGIDLEPAINSGMLQIHSSRPTMHGLEQHLVVMHDIVKQFKPQLVVVDPISNLTIERDDWATKPTLMRLIDFLKQQQVTSVFTNLVSGGSTHEESQMAVSSLMDTWILLRNIEYNGERNRTMYIMKSRGMHHSNQIREFVLGSDGIDLVEAYIGKSMVLTGAARATQEANERQIAEKDRQDHERRVRHLTSKQKTLEAQIALLQAECDVNTAEMNFALNQKRMVSESNEDHIDEMITIRGRGADDKSNKPHES